MIRWHKVGPSEYAGDVDGTEVARVALTGRRGVDHYPWDWYFTDAGEARRRPGARTSGVTDTLRSAKEQVAYLLA